MLLSGHGKRCGSTARFSEVGGTTVIGGSVVTSGSTSGRSRSSGRGTSTIGQPLGRTTEAGRRPGLETSRTRGAQSAFASGRFTAHRAWVEAGAAGPGLRNGSVDLVARGPSDRAGMRGEVSPVASLAHSAATGLELPASGRARAGTRRREDWSVETAALAGD